MLDYFYGGQADLFSFYRLPKALFVDPRFRGISAESKILYGLLLDRMGLSAKNGWTDDTGRVYIIFTTEEIMEALYCADNKATKLMKELESCGLIERKRRGLGKPSLIYVKNFISESSEPRIQNRENHDSGTVKNATLESLKSRGIKNNQNNTDLSETDPFLSDVAAGTETEGKDDRTLYQEYFSRQINFEALIAGHPDDDDDKPAEVVKAQLMKLNGDHLRFVLMCLKENTTQVRNIRQYLLATLYNAPMTMHSSYAARVQHDFKTG